MRIPLTSTFTPIPEGNHIFQITGAEYNQDFGVMKVELTCDNGQKKTETYRLLDGNGNANNGAMFAFSQMAKSALRDPDAESVEPQDLIGRYFAAEIRHDKVTSTKPGHEGEERIFARITRTWEADTPTPSTTENADPLSDF